MIYVLGGKDDGPGGWSSSILLKHHVAVLYKNRTLTSTTSSLITVDNLLPMSLKSLYFSTSLFLSRDKGIDLQGTMLGGNAAGKGQDFYSVPPVLMARLGSKREINHQYSLFRLRIKFQYPFHFLNLENSIERLG